MKLMFNEIGGKKLFPSYWDCESCVFHDSKWCSVIEPSNPLFRWCENEIYVETSLDIFQP